MDRKAHTTIINRLRRIEGQLRGVQKLVEADAPCIEILTQVSAVTGAMKRAGTEVIRVYLEQCIAQAAGSPEPERARKMEEFQKALSRYIDMA